MRVALLVYFVLFVIASAVAWVDDRRKQKEERIQKALIDATIESWETP